MTVIRDSRTANISYDGEALIPIESQTGLFAQGPQRPAIRLDEAF
jgi:hypothetical protein